MQCEKAPPESDTPEAGSIRFLLDAISILNVLSTKEDLGNVGEMAVYRSKAKRKSKTIPEHSTTCQKDHYRHTEHTGPSWKELPMIKS